MVQNDTLLYLYSSNIRPLYEQDILDLIAAPAGVTYQFRYDSRYINEGAKRQWTALAGQQAVIHFSLQQESQFHGAVFIPVRMATVRRGFLLGAIHVVELTLGEYVALPEPSPEVQENSAAQRVQEYARFLTDRDIPRPYTVSAGLGKSILDASGVPLERGGDQHLLFARTCSYLQRTQSFRNARFYRFLSLSEKTGDGKERSTNDAGYFVLDAGKSYELALVHQQPVDLSKPEKFSISVDDGIVRLIGKHEFEIASRYDIVTIPFYAIESSVYESRDTVLVIEPQPSEQGPRLRLPLRVESSLARSVAAVGGSATGLVLLGLPSLFPDMASVFKVLLVFGGGMLAAGLPLFLRRR